MRRLVCLVFLAVSVSACAPEILPRRSALPEHGVCMVEETGYTTPPGVPPLVERSEYDARGRIVQRTYHPEYHSVAVLSYRRDGAGRLVAIDFAYRRGAMDIGCANIGGCAEPAFNFIGRVEISRDPAGRVVQRVEQRTHGFATTVRKYAYDTAGRLTAKGLEYEGAGTLPARWRWHNDDGAYGVDTFTYDARGLLTERRSVDCLKICGEPEVERYEYDARGALVRVVHPKGSEDRWGYDDAGRVVSRGNERQAERWRYEYDAEGRLARETQDGQVARTYRYQGDCAHVQNGVEVPSPSCALPPSSRSSRSSSPARDPLPRPPPGVTQRARGRA